MPRFPSICAFRTKETGWGQGLSDLVLFARTCMLLVGAKCCQSCQNLPDPVVPFLISGDNLANLVLNLGPSKLVFFGRASDVYFFLMLKFVKSNTNLVSLFVWLALNVVRCWQLFDQISW